MKTYEEYQRWATLTDAILEIAMENYFDHKPLSSAWRARQIAIGHLQREIIALRADPLPLPRSCFLLQAPVQGGRL